MQGRLRLAGWLVAGAVMAFVSVRVGWPGLVAVVATFGLVIIEARGPDRPGAYLLGLGVSGLLALLPSFTGTGPCRPMPFRGGILSLPCYSALLPVVATGFGVALGAGVALLVAIPILRRGQR